MKVERETGKQLKYVRVDSGSECGGPFEEYYKKYGIRLEKTIPKTPRQSRMIERRT